MEAELGKYNTLEVLRIFEHGSYLQSEPEDILLPTKYMPADLKVGDKIEVFVYKDSEYRIIATTLKPFGVVGTYAVLECKDEREVGAFVEWGLEKDLMIPHAEQHRRMNVGEKYVVRICIDPKTNRLFGTTRLAAFLSTDQYEALKPGQQVSLLIYEQTDLGHMALIDLKYRGILYKNEVYKTIKVGDKLEGYIKKIREDNKIDLTLDKFGYSKVKDAQTVVLEKLIELGGTMNFSDKTAPDIIKAEFGMSKGVFKNALGSLYKENKITITPTAVQLVQK